MVPVARMHKILGAVGVVHEVLHHLHVSMITRKMEARRPLLVLAPHEVPLLVREEIRLVHEELSDLQVTWGKKMGVVLCYVFFGGGRSLLCGYVFGGLGGWC